MKWPSSLPSGMQPALSDCTTGPAGRFHPNRKGRASVPRLEPTLPAPAMARYVDLESRVSDTFLRPTSILQRDIETIRALHEARRRVGKPTVPYWTVEGYREAVEQSSLKIPVKRTLQVMVDHAGSRQTDVDRLTVSLLTGLKAERTVTEHWKKARAAGLLKSKARWNSSCIHTFLIPGADFLYDMDGVDDEQWGELLSGWHVWTPGEAAWWEGLQAGSWISPPWQDGRLLPPF